LCHVDHPIGEKPVDRWPFEIDELSDRRQAVQLHRITMMLSWHSVVPIAPNNFRVISALFRSRAIAKDNTVHLSGNSLRDFIVRSRNPAEHRAGLAQDRASHHRFGKDAVSRARLDDAPNVRGASRTTSAGWRQAMIKIFCNSLVITRRRKLIASALVYGLSLTIRFTSVAGDDSEASQARNNDPMTSIMIGQLFSKDLPSGAAFRHGSPLASRACRKACEPSGPMSISNCSSP
jgi:hypothetical protein